MRIALAYLCLAACKPSPAPPPPPPVSACNEQVFDGSSFTVCDPGKDPIRIIAGHRRFAELGLDPATVDFAMNAGMFDEAGRPIGLLVENGREVHAINRRKGGGNFHLLPNGVFLVRKDGGAAVRPSERFAPSADIAFATQSGPMLVIDGLIHPKFDADGPSRYVRNGVGIAPDGHPLFVISIDAVSFGKLARFFRDRLKVRDALYFDGSVSSLWDPANNRLDNFTELGPMVVVFRRRSGRGGGP